LSYNGSHANGLTEEAKKLKLQERFRAQFAEVSDLKALNISLLGHCIGRFFAGGIEGDLQSHENGTFLTRSSNNP
jgi:hypothetical protein